MADDTTSASLHQRRENTNNQEKVNGHIIQNGSLTPPPTPPRNNPNSFRALSLNILQIWAPILLLIFGGCCSNVYTLESLIQTYPASGAIITAFQFLVTALITLPSHLSLSRGWRHLFLKDRAIPITKWAIYTLFFLAINTLNNKAFSYKISVPLHIILRSAGPVTTMLVGRVVAKRSYPNQKILAVILLFVGVVVAALSDSYAKPRDTILINPISPNSVVSPATVFWSQAPGFGLLASALFLAALMGLYTDGLYSTYGRSAKVVSESLFYSHALSLTFFASTLSSLKPEFSNLMATSPSLSSTLVTSAYMPTSSPNTSLLLHKILVYIPTTLITLLLNALTQYICISGVNRLGVKSSSLTVSIVLNVRKLASLILSIWLFGNRLPWGVLVGAGMVFAGGAMYALPVRKKKEDTRTASGTVEGKKEL